MRPLHQLSPLVSLLSSFCNSFFFSFLDTGGIREGGEAQGRRRRRGRKESGGALKAVPL